MLRVRKIFGRSSRIVIGVIHFPPLLGYPGFPGFAVALRDARRDLRALVSGGVDGICIENNYDVPHRVNVEPETLAAMTLLGGRLREETDLPLGVSVLWNDYHAALAIAKAIGGQFIRIPVFVDTIRTKDCGVIRGNAREAVRVRSKLHAEDVALLTDIHVKHATLLSKTSLASSARQAMRAGSDGLIVTGAWTGQPPAREDLAIVRRAVGRFSVFVGSGATTENAGELLSLANGVIVSTSLKKGTARRHERNVKSFSQRISKSAVVRFINRVHQND